MMHSTNRMKWLFLAGVIVIAAVGLWLVPQNRNDREVWEGGGVVTGSSSNATPFGDTKAGPPSKGTTGTSGAHGAPSENGTGHVLTEIETITGINDGMTLVGRRVDLHVEVQGDPVSDQAFWVGPPGNRVLVVLERDTRDGAERQRGLPSDNTIAPVRGRERAAISGVIRPVPKSEQRFSWNLTRDDARELADRKIYISADSVRSEGHGGS